MKMLPFATVAALVVSTSFAFASGPTATDVCNDGNPNNDDDCGVAVGSASSSGLNGSSTLLLGAGGALLMIGLAAGLGGSASGTN